jgi:beta-lactam-binding protein with PASTA domain
LTDNHRIIAGRYQLGNLIGRGGMADVYEGTDTRLGRVVAIKLLKSDLANDPNFEARFRQEAQASARMAHPTIVRIYDAGEEEGVDANGNQIRKPYIVMEYVKGSVLRDLMHQRRLTIEEAVSYTDGVLTALATSHNAGIIHRDIKSANIMITDSGAVKVMDFGIARAISDSSSTQAHTVGIMGTAQYFSPEQARGENVDARTDLYSTGVLLYEMLAGRAPFKGETAVSVAYQHVSEPVTPPSAHNPMISPELDAVVMQSMAKERGDRFQTAEDFREHLAAAVAATLQHQQAQALQTGSLPLVNAEDFAEAGASAAEVVAAAPVDAAAPTTPMTALDEFEALLRGDDVAAPAVESAAPEVTSPAPQNDYEYNAESVAAPVETPVVAEFAGIPEETPAPAAAPAAPAVPVPSAAPTAAPAASVSADTTLLTNPFEALGLEAPEYTTSSQAISTDTSSLTRVRRSSGAPSPRLLWGIGSGLGVIIVGVLIWVLAMGGFPNLVVNAGGTGGVSVPNVTNSSYTDGYNTLTNAKLLVTKVYQASDTVPVDTIISTDPPAGTNVSESTLVTVYVSSGKGQVQVPDLTGLTEEAASTALTNAKLTLGTITQANSANIPLGQVLSSDPAKGTNIAAGTVVNLVVSNGQVLVPDVRNLDVTSAKVRLSAPDVGLQVTVAAATACTGTLGNVVLDQSILPGLAQQGSVVTLTVACNP